MLIGQLLLEGQHAHLPQEDQLACSQGLQRSPQSAGAPVKKEFLVVLIVVVAELRDLLVAPGRSGVAQAAQRELRPACSTGSKGTAGPHVDQHLLLQVRRRGRPAPPTFRAPAVVNALDGRRLHEGAPTEGTQGLQERK